MHQIRSTPASTSRPGAASGSSSPDPTTAASEHRRGSAIAEPEDVLRGRGSVGFIDGRLQHQPFVDGGRRRHEAVLGEDAPRGANRPTHADDPQSGQVGHFARRVGQEQQRTFLVGRRENPGERQPGLDHGCGRKRNRKRKFGRDQPTGQRKEGLPPRKKLGDFED